jgi:hypothetical protein
MSKRVPRLWRHEATGKEYKQVDKPGPGWRLVKEPSARPPAGTPTDLNLWVLRNLFDGADVAPNKIDLVSVPHVRRCLKAGLITITDAGTTLTLTAAGKVALGRHE